MKTYVQFDSEGRIHSVITVDAPDGVWAMVDVEPGLSVAEIDSAEITPPTTEAELTKMLALTQHYRVSAPAMSKAKLEKAQ